VIAAWNEEETHVLLPQVDDRRATDEMTNFRAVSVVPMAGQTNQTYSWL
jgi:hypothetical protein